MRLGNYVGLEVEVPARPCEQEEHRLLDLHPDVVLEVFPGDGSYPYQDLPHALVPLAPLLLDRGVELLPRDLSILQEEVPNSIAAVDQRRKRDPSPVEIDVSQVAAIAHRQASGLLAQREELEHVRQ